MYAKNQLTGMRGVYLVAAELARHGFIASPTSRSAQAADILATDPDNQGAIILLLLSLSDQFTDNIPENLDKAWSLLPRLKDDYLQAYYQGLLFERQARVYMRRASPGSGFSAYDLFCDAMRLYEKAARVRPPGNDEALLRWNTCARTIMSSRLQPRPIDDFRPMLE